jgi:4-amino-4-deoxy-L-arabinose transferase-like glycosyltransferase
MASPTSTEPPSWSDWGIALGVTTVAFILLMNSMGIGFPRDESFYFHAASEYIGWFRDLWDHWQAGELWRSFTKENIDEHWSYNAEHPVLMKTLFALSDQLFHHSLGWTKGSVAMRIPAVLCGSALVGCTYLFATQIFGRLAGLVAAGALLFQPRFFWHAHLACFDVPIAFFWTAVIYAYWRSYHDRRWALACGVLFGLALLTKLNSFFLPLVLGGHWLLTHWRHLRIRRDERGWSLEGPGIPWAFVAMLIVGPLMFYALTPRYWFDTWERIRWYLNFHLGHVQYFVQYFGEDVLHPPLPVTYPWVMTLVTVPVGILLAAGLGITAALLKWDPRPWMRRWLGALREGRLPTERPADRRATGLLLAINAIFPIALISLPNTPVFGGTKHWMPAMPFLAILAGAGVTLAWQRMRDDLLEDHTVASGGLAVLLSLAVLGPAALATASIHPFGTSYYNTAIGGIRGAADRQMFRQFWGYAARQGLPWLNRRAPEGSRIWIHNTTGYAWGAYREEGLVRQDLRSWHGIRTADYAMFYHQRAFTHQHADIWRHYQTRAPASVVSHRGVPLLSIYQKQAAKGGEDTVR